MEQGQRQLPLCFNSILSPYLDHKLQAVPSIMSTQPGSHHSPHSYSQHRQAVAAARDPQSNLGIFKIFLCDVNTPICYMYMYLCRFSSLNRAASYSV